MPNPVIVGLGTTALAILLPDSRVLKSPHFETNGHIQTEVEAKVYERFSESPPPPFLLRYYGRLDGGIILEYAENGNIRHYRSKITDPPDEKIIFR